MVELLVDPRLAQISPGSIPADWATRALFCHPYTFDRWAERSTDVEALEGQQEAASLYAAMVARLEEAPDYFISFGAGGGMVDKAVLAAAGDPRPHYVAIDISRPMCEVATQNLRDVCPVPFAIVGDFEGGFDYVRRALAPVMGARKLIACTGNTIGNLDLGERNLFDNLFALMEPGDGLLVSVATGAFGLPIDRPRFDAEVGWKDLSGLLASGISMMTGETLQAVESDLDRRLVIAEGSSDIPGAETLILRDRVSARALLYLRRYDFACLRDWIVRSFPADIVGGEEQRPPHAGFGVGVLMLVRTR